MENHGNPSFQSQISQSASVDLQPFQLEYRELSGAIEVQLMQTKFFWIPDSTAYKRSKFQPKRMSYEGDMIFQR